MGPWKWFNPDATDPKLKGVDPETISKLDIARQWTVDNDPDKAGGAPMQITSGLRTADKECALKGGVHDSAHEAKPPSAFCRGVDIAVFSTRSLALMVFGLREAGFTRIGTYWKISSTGSWQPTHIHVDDDPSLPPMVMWILAEQN